MRLPTISFYETPPNLADKVFWFAWRVFMGLSLLAIVLMAGLAGAQSPGVQAVPQPAWLTLLLGLAPWLIGAAVAFHPLLKLGALFHALAKKHTGLAAAALEDLGIVADDVDAYVTKNGGSLKDLTDPAKRAAAEEALVADAKVEAKQAVDDALARALPHG
jgi:hypothetical protein